MIAKSCALGTNLRLRLAWCSPEGMTMVAALSRAMQEPGIRGPVMLRLTAGSSAGVRSLPIVT